MGAYVLIGIARKHLAEQQAKLSAIAVSQAVPGYVSAPGGQVALQEVAKWLKAPLKWDAQARQAVLSYKGETWRFTPGVASVKSDAGKILPLPWPVTVESGRMQVPLEVLRLAGQVKWDPSTRIARLKPAS